jgi:hypothetical protein
LTRSYLVAADAAIAVLRIIAAESASVLAVSIAFLLVDQPVVLPRGAATTLSDPIATLKQIARSVDYSWQSILRADSLVNDTQLLADMFH